MKPAVLQTDLFADLDPSLFEATPARPSPHKPAAVRMAPSARRMRAFDPEAAIQALEATEDYRVLRRLKPREIDAAYREKYAEDSESVESITSPDSRATTIRLAPRGAS